LKLKKEKQLEQQKQLTGRVVEIQAIESSMAG